MQGIGRPRRSASVYSIFITYVYTLQKQNNIAIISTDRAEIIVTDSSEFILSRRYMYLLYMCVLRGRTTASVRLSLLYTCTVCNK